MGFFSRVGNLWKGFWGLFISDMEANNAEAVYESAIEERIQKHRELKKAVSGIVYLRNKLSTELEQKQAALVHMRAGDMRAAKAALERAKELGDEFAQVHFCRRAPARRPLS